MGNGQMQLHTTWLCEGILHVVQFGSFKFKIRTVLDMYERTCVMVSWQLITAEVDIEVCVQSQHSVCWICGE
jgi:hypothetical protein